jgi:hypothetical protein
MRLVQTLVVRDEVDVVGAQIAYHLNAGVDFVLAADHESRDGTTEVLESFVQEGSVLRIPVQGEMREEAWRTEMARRAAIDHGADWVLNTDADEFWMPRGGTLKESFAAVPAHLGVVWALSRTFVPRPEGDAPFSERMTVRLSSPAAINDPTSPYRPHAKVAHRADPGIVVRHGAHLAYSQHAPFYDWFVADVLHFPYRRREQYERKASRRVRDKPLGQYVRADRAREEGRVDEVYGSLVVDDSTLERGLESGSLVVDTRLRDALRSGGTSATGRRDLGAISEEAGLREADLVRAFRRVDGLEARLAAIERRVRGASGRRGRAQAAPRRRRDVSVVTP